jgi:RNA polymerase sigma-70 factor (ECF subfamily)
LRWPIVPDAADGNRNVTANESILARVAAGDAGAVGEFMDRYGALVWSLVRSRIRNVADAEDATQEIFIELWKHAGRYDPSVASEAVFVAMIARRRLVDRLRALGRQPPIEQIDEEQLPLLAPLELEDKHANAFDVALAAKAVGELDEAQREVVLLGVVQGMSHAEIAEATGKPLGTVKTQLRRGLHRVREMLGGSGGGPEKGE